MSEADSQNLKRQGRRRLLLRADAGRSRGYGHVMRCLTLGTELLSRGWEVTLLSRDLDQFLYDRASSAGIGVRMLERLVGSSDDAAEVLVESADLTVVDGYDFSTSYFSQLDECDVCYMVIDDDARVTARGALLTVNQNPHSNESMYPGLDPTRLLLGAEFAMVRKEVTQLRKVRSSLPADQVDRVLVSIGGTDIGGLTSVVAETLCTNSDWEVVASLAEPPAGCSAAPPDIAVPLSQATVAVIGAGSTLWEACCLGVPTLALIVADNQVGGSQKAAQHGACELIDCRQGVDLNQIRKRVPALASSTVGRSVMSDAGMRLVDGHGASRVVAAIEKVLISR